MATSRNPFALLQEDGEEGIINPTPSQPKQTKPVTVAKDNNKPLPKTKKTPIVKNTKKVEIKGSFEEEPVHKEVSGTENQEKQHREKKRQFDRKSNTSKNLSQKKSTGKGSWGDEVDGQTFTQEEEEEQEKLRQEQELEQSYKSLEDYQKEKQTVKKEVQVRAPNEGVDEKQWKKLTQVVKNDEIEELFAGKKTNKKIKEKERKTKEKPVKTVIAIEQTFAPVQRDRPERSDRGSARKGGDRGNFKGGKGGKPKDLAPGSGRGKKAVNVMDPNAFPSLVAN